MLDRLLYPVNRRLWLREQLEQSTERYFVRMDEREDLWTSNPVDHIGILDATTAAMLDCGLILLCLQHTAHGSPIGSLENTFEEIRTVLKPVGACTRHTCPKHYGSD